MEFDTYQKKARETAIYPGSEKNGPLAHAKSLSEKAADEILQDIILYYNENDLDDGLSASRRDDVKFLIKERLKLLDMIPLLYTALGLAGETGELLEKIKKVIRDKDGIIDETTKEKIKGEISDTFWYSANLATELGLNMSDIAQFNLDKLASRKERGVLQGSGDNR